MNHDLAFLNNQDVSPDWSCGRLLPNRRTALASQYYECCVVVLLTKIEPTSHSVRTRPAVELRPLHPRSEARSFPCRDWVGCITATPQPPESTAGERTGLSH